MTSTNIEHSIETGLPTLHPGTIARHRREAGNYIFPRPDVKPVNVPMNDRALMLAMALSGYTIAEIHWGSPNYPFVKIHTESVDPKYRSLLKGEFEDWGKPSNSVAKPGYYLHYDSFKFLLNPDEVLAKNFPGTDIKYPFLVDPFRYTPFLWGLIYLRLSREMYRLTFENKDPQKKLDRVGLMEFIYEHYQASGFRLGPDRKPLPLGQPPKIRHDSGTGYMVVDDPTAVISDLNGEAGVRRLRIFKNRDSTSDSDDERLEEVMNSFLTDVREVNAEKAKLAQIRDSFLSSD